MPKIAKRTKSTLSKAVRIKKSAPHTSPFIRIVGVAIAILILYFVGKAIYQNMAINSSASVSDQCKNQLTVLGAAKRSINNLTKAGEEIDSDTQEEYDEAYRDYLDCKNLVQQSKNEKKYGEVGTDKPVACGQRSCSTSETCMKTNSSQSQSNGGYECVVKSPTSDCRTGSNPNNNCDPSSFCNMQTGRCVKSSSVDGSVIDSKKANCTPTYVRNGCGPNGDGVQTCTRNWSDAKDACINISCGKCAF